MTERTTGYYRLGELSEEARRRAYETWRDYWIQRADALLDGEVDEDTTSLKASLESVGCKLADYSVYYDGSGTGSCLVELEDWLVADIESYDAYKKPFLEDVPQAKPTGLWLGEGFAERWNSGCRPKLAAMLGDYAKTLAASGDDEVDVVAYGEARTLKEAYLALAQEQADECMAEIDAAVEHRWSEEGFRADDESAGWYYEEDGTYADHV